MSRTGLRNHGYVLSGSEADAFIKELRQHATVVPMARPMTPPPVWETNARKRSDAMWTAGVLAFLGTVCGLSAVGLVALISIVL